MDMIEEWFGSGRLKADEARARAFWAGEGRCLVSCSASSVSYRQLPLERMRPLVAENLRHQAALPGCNLPAVLGDFGTVSTGRDWGGKELVGEGGNPHLEPITADLAAACELPIRSVDDPGGDPERGLALFRSVCDELSTRQLWFRTPDMQGTLTTAALVVEQTAFMMAMFDQPAVVHRFLGRVCDHLLAFQQHLREGSGHRVCGNIWPWTWLPPELGISLTEDYMPLLGPAEYAEFGLPYLRQLAEAFGGALVHCCGAWGRHVPTLAASGIPLRAVEFHHPFTTVEELAPLAAQGVVLIPNWNARDGDFADAIAYYRHLLADTPYRYWFALNDDPAACAFAEAVELERLVPG